MDFELSEDQEEVRRAACALLDDLAPMTRVRQVALSSSAYDVELWSAMARQGWMAIDMPESGGGLGMGMVEVAVLCEQLGRHVAPVPYLGTVVARGSLERAVAAGEVDPSASLGGLTVQEWVQRLSGVAGPAAVGAVAWSADGKSVQALPADSPAVTPASGRARSEEWLLVGRGDPVVFGPEADLIVVLATPAPGSPGAGPPSLFAVVPGPGQRCESQAAMDLTRCLGWLELDAHPAVRLGGPDAVESLLERAASAVSAEMLGSAGRVEEMAVQYAKDREQFGRAIGSFQAVKHRCADMLVDIEGMRSIAYYAAWSVGAGAPDGTLAASAAKVFCSDAARRVMASGLQVHGGIGFTWEHDLHLYMKRSQLDQVSFGNAGFHRSRLAGLLRSKAEAGLPVM
ncbi:MAG: acyl-CoA dehydrogenase family protein [Acidimicrobiales bacterium]